MNNTQNCHIEVNGLRYAYDGQSAIAFPDMCIARGEHWLITGQSGSGKTTLLHLLAGLRKPQAGKVIIDQNDTAKMSNAQLDRFRGKHIGIVFQTSHFVQSLTIAENLALARFLAKNKPDSTRVSELLDRLGLSDKKNKKPHQLSVGEQQRAAIARAMVNQPAVVLADEPTASLDDDNCKRMIELLRGECEKAGSTLLIVTHDQRLKDLIKNTIQL